MTEYKFPWPNEEKGYNLFPKELEEDTNVLFHGTLMENFDSIIKNGFKSGSKLGGGTNPDYKLESVSYAKSSIQCLSHVFQNRNSTDEIEHVVFVVKFNSLNELSIRNNDIDIHVFDPALQPEIIGYCVIPSNYVFK